VGTLCTSARGGLLQRICVGHRSSVFSPFPDCKTGATGKIEPRGRFFRDGRSLHPERWRIPRLRGLPRRTCAARNSG
jgi:hypothetical protein